MRSKLISGNRAMTLSMSCQWWLNTLFNKSWDKSVIIGYNLERSANSMANLEHVTLYFDNLVDKNGTLSVIFHPDFFTPLWIHARPSGRIMFSLSWNLCVQRVYDAQMRKNANPVFEFILEFADLTLPQKLWIFLQETVYFSYARGYIDGTIYFRYRQIGVAKTKN